MENLLEIIVTDSRILVTECLLPAVYHSDITFSHPGALGASPARRPGFPV
ncbi:MAG: hypothetical protein LBF62_11030 [Tannerellaceae bacterium]|nr:hypothetical protein [Tannerellaceae bacterium]